MITHFVLKCLVTIWLRYRASYVGGFIGLGPRRKSAVGGGDMDCLRILDAGPLDPARNRAGCGPTGGPTGCLAGCGLTGCACGLNECGLTACGLTGIGLEIPRVCIGR